MIDTQTAVSLMGAATCGASLLSAYCLVRWRRAELAAERWHAAAEGYARLVGRARVPALTIVAPAYHAPWSEPRRVSAAR